LSQNIMNVGSLSHLFIGYPEIYNKFLRAANSRNFQRLPEKMSA